MIEVRDATVDDLDWLLGQLKDFTEFFNSERSLFPNREYAENYILGLINDHVVLVAEQDHNLMGLIAGTLINHPYNPEIKMLAESFWWVDEKYRGSRAGALLFCEFMDLGKKMLGPGGWITMSLESNSPVNPDVLTKRGFRLQEHSYLMEVK